MSNYNTKDIFLQRRTSTGTFEEYPLHATASSILKFNENNDLIALYFTTSNSSSYAISSSYAPNLYPQELQISVSWASSSLSSSYTLTASYALNASEALPTISSSWASSSLSSSYATTASYLSSSVLGNGINTIVSLTAEEYYSITPVETTLYIITS